MDGFLHLPPFILQRRNRAQLCHSRISGRGPVLNKTRQGMSACDRVQIGSPPRSLLCYRCCVRNMLCTLGLLWAIMHPSIWYPPVIVAAHVVWLSYVFFLFIYLTLLLNSGSRRDNIFLLYKAVFSSAVVLTPCLLNDLGGLQHLESTWKPLCSETCFICNAKQWAVGRRLNN